MSEPATTTVWTDGACRGNPGPGGWAWAVRGGEYRSGAEPSTTNQRMELHAALDAVTSLRGRVRVVSDSTYVVNCFKNRWWEGWLRKGWKNSQRQPVANRDLWEPLIDEYLAAPDRLDFAWVKGHSGDLMNDLVDRLAVEAAARQTGRAGTGAPADLGPPDQVRRPRPGLGETEAEDAGTGDTGTGDTGTGDAGTEVARAEVTRAEDAVADAHVLVVTGLRPPALGGYDDNLLAASVRRRLGEVLAAKATVHPDLVVVTGLGLGAEQLAAEAAADAGVGYVAVLAFEGQDRMWPAASRRRFVTLLAGAREVVVLHGLPPSDKQAAGRALARRDEWLGTHADEAVVVWDESDATVGRRVRDLERRLGEEQVWVVTP